MSRVALQRGTAVSRKVPIMASKKNDSYRPGQTVPKSGQWGLYGPRGGDTGQEVTSTKGEPFPPTPKPGMQYKLNDQSK